MQPGDTLYLRSGTYTGGQSVTLGNVVIQSWAAERALISTPTTSPGTVATLHVNATGVTLRNLDLQGGYDNALLLEQGGAYIVRCTFSSSGTDCIAALPGADGVELSQCDIHDSGQRSASGADGVDVVNGDSFVARDCYIHDVAAEGICVRGGSINALVERCLVVNAGGAGVQLGGGSNTADLDTGQNPTYRENIDGVIRNCIVVNAQAAGIGCIAALRPIIQNNTLVDVAKTTAAGLHMASTQHVSVDRMCEDAEFSNNIVALSAGSGGDTIAITATGLTGALTMRNNRYSDAGGAAVFSDARAPGSWGLAQWQTNEGTDSTSTEGVLGLDSSWHLAGGSACIGQGFMLAAFSDDYDGDVRSGAWDIGADQSGGTALTTPPASGRIGTGGGVPDAPAAPSGLAVAVNPGNYLIITWTDNATIESGFRLERQVGAGSFTTLLTLEPNDTAHFDGNVSDGVLYTYRVIALGPGGDSAASNSDAATMVGTPSSSGGSSGGGGGGCALSNDGSGLGWLFVLLSFAFCWKMPRQSRVKRI